MKKCFNYEMDNTQDDKFSLKIKRACNLIFGITFVIGMSLIPLGTVNAAGAMKWHPGHYYILTPKQKSIDSYMNMVYDELQSTPALRGVQARFSWPELEPSKGVYNFALIDKLLAQLSSRKKRLFVHVGLKSFDLDGNVVPNYMKVPEYEGGQFVWAKSGSKTPKGRNVKLWNPKVRDRLAALFTAMGKRYNSHPFFEGITMNETALGNALPSMTDAQENGWFDNLAILHQKIRVAFPNTVTFHYLNYPRDQLSELIGKFKQSDTGIGCPDVFLEDPGVNHPTGIYSYYRKNNGMLPLMVQIEHANYLNTRHDNTGFVPTMAQLNNFAKNELDVNYIFWTRLPQYKDKILEFLRFKTQATALSGGLRSNCPSAFSSCKTN